MATPRLPRDAERLILGHLDLRGTLTCMRVCRAWRDILSEEWVWVKHMPQPPTLPVGVSRRTAFYLMHGLLKTHGSLNQIDLNKGLALRFVSPTYMFSPGLRWWNPVLHSEPSLLNCWRYLLYNYGQLNTRYLSVHTFFIGMPQRWNRIQKLSLRTSTIAFFVYLTASILCGGVALRSYQVSGLNLGFNGWTALTGSLSFLAATVGWAVHLWGAPYVYPLGKYVLFLLGELVLLGYPALPVVRSRWKFHCVVAPIAGFVGAAALNWVYRNNIPSAGKLVARLALGTVGGALLLMWPWSAAAAAFLSLTILLVSPLTEIRNRCE